jgi:hypothetical protein
MLWQTNGWWIIAVVIGAFLAAMETGYRLGLYHRDPDEPGRAHIGALQGGLLGLMALLLAFSMSMSVSRFDSRKAMVLEEANAIGTTWLRSQLLSAEAGRESEQLLRDYVTQRLAFFSEDLDVEGQKAAGRRASTILTRLWQIAAAEGRAHPDADVLTLYIESLNQTIDLGEKRVAIRNNHLPDTILYVLFSVMFGSMAFIGYGNGLSGRRRIGSNIIFAVLVMMVLVVIMDMDRPSRGFIQVGQGSMLRLQESMANATTTAAP